MSLVAIKEIEDILIGDSAEDKSALFSFDKDDSDECVWLKFYLFTNTNYDRYFKGKDAPFHKEMVMNFIKSYRGGNFVDIAFRGSSKTSLCKLFVTFVLLNDIEHFRRYVKVNTRDLKNAKQIVTDVYNMCIEVRDIYGDVFAKEGEKKREERMDSFTMKSGVKLTAGTVGQSQRGNIQDAYRPDWIWFEDVEDRESISSQAITQSIIARCDEAITGLDINGSWILTANYISEDGVVQWFRDKKNKVEQIIPIINAAGLPTWSIYTPIKIADLKTDAEDWYGDYLCDPSRSENKFFDIDRIESDLKACREPDMVKDGVCYWKPYLSHHRYGIGADTGEGVGLDSNALAGFDFSTGELVVDYHSNEIKPELFAYVIRDVAIGLGKCVAAPEINNMSGGIVIVTLKAIYDNIYQQMDQTKIKETESLKLGWHTNSRSKPQMFMDFRRDYNDGIVKIYDRNVLKEMKAYGNQDIIENPNAKITRHFDLLTATVIAWQMKNVLREAKTAVVQHHAI